jgi:hypothetical protein
MVFEPWYHPPVEDPIRPRFQSLTHLVQSVVRRFEADGYWWDPTDGFLMDRTDLLDSLIEQERREMRAAPSLA